tara:strand:- start:34 stop:546 length:513 start_codon:yes stop_codon:yes gene_type:complete
MSRAKEIKDLKGRVARLKERIAELERSNQTLVQLVDEAGSRALAGVAGIAQDQQGLWKNDVTLRDGHDELADKFFAVVELLKMHDPEGLGKALDPKAVVDTANEVRRARWELEKKLNAEEEARKAEEEEGQPDPETEHMGGLAGTIGDSAPEGGTGEPDVPPVATVFGGE